MHTSNLITLSTRRMEKQLENFSAEQRLKMLILDRLMGSTYVEMAIDEGISVDTLFTITAEVFVSKDKIFFKE
ncbi:hypothetical protein GPJ61_27525 [Brevibacillus formosus]|uniref:hypothetical protein n=1 Tax=Brevibacillus formosus TaxID=54913 RepID=UPI001CA503C1|nr:hypothetical protein [Brevibacillus formosus]MBW5471541.1 hypothetical protein [Brevibacillus formosus]